MVQRTPRLRGNATFMHPSIKGKLLPSGFQVKTTVTTALSIEADCQMQYVSIQIAENFSLILSWLYICQSLKCGTFITKKQVDGS